MHCAENFEFIFSGLRRHLKTFADLENRTSKPSLKNFGSLGRKVQFLAPWDLKFEIMPMSYILLCDIMDYLRMDGKQYASKVRNKALEDFDWLSQ